MDEGWVEEIRKNLESKSSEELVEIWQTDDRNAWSDAAFAAIQRILEGRGVDPGLQGPPAAEEKAPQAELPRRPGCVTAFAVVIVLGAILGVLQQGMALLSLPYLDDGSMVGMAVACCIAVLYAVVAVGLWRLKNWARIAVIVLLGLNVLLSGLLVLNGILPALLGVAVSGACLYWFAANKKVFVAGE